MIWFLSLKLEQKTKKKTHLISKKNIYLTWINWNNNDLNIFNKSLSVNCFVFENVNKVVVQKEQIDQFEVYWTVIIQIMVNLINSSFHYSY